MLALDALSVLFWNLHAQVMRVYGVCSPYS